MTQPGVSIAITADDKTAKGWTSAEKRAGKSVDNLSRANRAEIKATQDGIAKGSKGIASSFSAIERASRSALGNGSILGRGGAVRDVATLTRGLGAASAEALGLEGTLAGVAGATAGIAGAAVLAGAAMWKLSDGWAKGANKLGNMASLIGVSTKGLQEFTGAAERAGVDRDTATGTMGSLSQTLNDARYGRNNQALAILGKMGVGMKTNADGTVDVEAMLPAIANALRGQNSSGRRTAAHALGIADAALPAFTQGGAALSADMADYGRNGAMMTDADTKLGHDLARRDTLAKQWGGKQWLELQKANAGLVKSAGDFASGAGPDLGALAQSAANKASQIMGTDGRASAVPSGPVAGVAPSDATTSSLADRIQYLGERSRQNQTSPKGAFGVMQLMTHTAKEAAAYRGIPYDDYRARHDQGYNRMLGEAYIEKLQRQFGTSDPAIIAAAYNGGPTIVSDWLNGTNRSRNNPLPRHLPDPRQGASDDDFIAGIPTRGGYKETHDYAARVAHASPQVWEHVHRHEIQLNDNRATVTTHTTSTLRPKISMASDHFQ